MTGPRIGVLGATSDIAEATMRRWASDASGFRLVARGSDALDLAAADLRARAQGAAVATLVADLGSTQGVRDAVDWLFADGALDIVLIAFGTMPSQTEADADPAVAAGLLELNGTLTLLAAHLGALALVEQGQGALVVIGSVAGDRGRASNYLYGAAKAMVATGVAGLQHRTAGSAVRVTLVKPGPTATKMTEKLAGGLPLARVEVVARDIVEGVAQGRPVVYTPRRWRLIMTVVRLLPRGVFERTRL